MVLAMVTVASGLDSPGIDLSDGPQNLRRRVILVTGAPRTATTPVGNMLSLASRTSTLYEPLGPTGFRRIHVRFPMVGNAAEELALDELVALVSDIAALRGRLKSQNRGEGPAPLRTRLFGSRTLHSFRLARLQPWADTVIWKDPHAVMLVPDLVAAGLPVVVTARRPHAHAASYKRLGWKSRAAEIYPRWQARFGADRVTEAWLERVGEPVISGALIWRLSYLQLLRTGCRGDIHLVTSDALEADEKATYLGLFDALGLRPTARLRRKLEQPRQAARAIPMSGQTHDWSRSVRAVNAYWKDLLDADEIAAVDAITREVADSLFD